MDWQKIALIAVLAGGLWQGARFYEWRPIAPLPIPVQEVIEHSANTHVIPANPAGAGACEVMLVQSVEVKTF